MAMQVGELFATLTLDDSAFYRATASAQSALAALSRSLGALSGQGRSAEIHQFHRTPAQRGGQPRRRGGPPRPSCKSTAPAGWA